MQIDTSEVRQLSVEWKKVPADLARHARPVVMKGATNIKKQLREEMGKSKHFKAARYIDFELDEDGYGAEIGPIKEGAGNLANIAYFGGAHGGGGTVPDLSLIHI